MKRAVGVNAGLGLLLVATVSVAAEEQGPAPVAANLTAQFYDVAESAVDIQVLQQSALAATVVATAPGGHVCTYEMVPAPADSQAPHGWLIAHTSCKS
ncbi:hypothetical protein CHR29_27985 (plasmid) [Pseudomonas monteilii]|jgi:hypothetical protein|uniref:hypothetical protein n=1 Tax=Pseudomonas TaxID=286 RepID=UPI000EF757B1|nr:MULTISPECIES: hypothetical protein [Pseudomonas]AYN18960.1 hypothetical protein CHR29_27985 [Pseudomonas monteilii]MCL8328775.1 hypothetical protein [Pseudomonas juntendi]MDD2061431.1 hypothetical protein [Pseudomonas putida]UJW25429.1 hypothetical protein L2Y89_27970 [Pseudomonas juntendi]